MFFSQVNLDLFPHNLIIPSPSTNSFIVNYKKCELLERTFFRVCDSILSCTIESALHPQKRTLDYRTEPDILSPKPNYMAMLKEFACQACPKLKRGRAAKDKVAQCKERRGERV